LKYKLQTPPHKIITRTWLPGAMFEVAQKST